MPFKPNKKFKKDYDKLFKKDPLQANMLLLMCELANENGEVIFPKNIDCTKEIGKLMKIRFSDVEEYAL